MPAATLSIISIIWLQQNGHDITQEEVEEEYTPSIRTEDPYLQRYRIELDSVAQKVGPEGLWKYIMYRVKLLAKADGLDYTNVIHKPASETLYPVEVIDFLSDLQIYSFKRPNEILHTPMDRNKFDE